MISQNDISTCVTKRTDVNGTPKEVVSELSLPDYLPDVSRLLKTEARIASQSSYFNEGSLEFDGRMDYEIVYATSDGRIKSVPLSENFGGSVPLPKDAENGESELRLEIENVTCRLQNPRRLSVKTKVGVTVLIYGEECVTPQISGALTPSEDARLEKKTDEINTVRRLSVKDENVPISEDLELDAQMPSIAEIISVGLSPYLSDVRAADGKITYKGDVTANVICLAQADDADAPAEYFSFSKKIPVSGEVKADGVTAECFANGYATVGDVEFRPQANSFGENRVVEVDFTYTAYLYGMCDDAVTAVGDMYSVNYESKNDMRQIESSRLLRAGEFNFTSDGALPLDEKDFSKVVSATASARMDSVGKNGSRLVFSGTADVCAILTNGAGAYVSKTFPLPLKAETEVGKSSDSIECDVFPSVLSVNVKADGGEIRAEVETGISYFAAEVGKADVVDKCAIMKDRPTKRPSSSKIIICYPSESDDLWSVAKRYSVPENEIRAANGFSGELPRGKIVIIPSERKGGR